MTPITKILEGVCDALKAAALTYNGKSVTVRHHRFKNAGLSETPCILVLWYGSSQPTAMHTMHELIYEATVRLEITVDQMAAAADPTGWGGSMQLAGQAANILIDPEGSLRLLVDDVVAGDCDPDTGNSPDNARLVQDITVLYRTPVNDLNTLLLPGGNTA